MPWSEDHIIIWGIEARTYPDFVVRYSDNNNKKYVVRQVVLEVRNQIFKEMKLHNFINK